MTIKEAQDCKVFIFSDYENCEIEETNLYDHVIQSVDETTTPNGVGPREFIEEVELHYDGDEHEDLKEYIRMRGITFADGHRLSLEDFDHDEKHDTYHLTYYVISTWGVRGNNYRSGDTWGSQYLTEEDAENAIFNRVYEHDFPNDCNRSTTFFDTEEEAIEDWADGNGLDIEVAKSYLRKRDLVKKVREERRVAAWAIQKAKDAEDEKYIETILPGLRKIDGEGYKETSKRLSDALDHQVSGTVFHRTVKKIRATC